MKNKWLLMCVLSAVLCVTGCAEKEMVAEQTETEDAVEKEEVSLPENNIGLFTTEDIYGETVTQDIFSDYDITLVNLFATWCGPCISEMPELSQLHKDMKDQGVNIVAVVLDASFLGETDPEIVSLAQQLDEMIDAEFTFMIPDETNLNGRLDSVSAVPESFFVDSEGNIVGEPYVGAKDYDTWKAIIETELANLKGED